MRGWLQLFFSGGNPRLVAECTLAARILPDIPPTLTAINFNYDAGVDPRPIPELVETCSDLSVRWGEGVGAPASFSYSRKHDEVYLHRNPWDITSESVLALVREWPFETCITNPLLYWDETYRSVHGWAFVLKGRGHRLVSPRIIPRGPWRLLRDEVNDVTLFQFHDLDADAETALQQAKPGHALLDPVWCGGHFASQMWVFRGSCEGLYKPTFYDPATKTSIVLVQDREVAADEMAVAAATRVHQIYTQPVEQVAFVYMDETTARRQLPELWLYGLEVRAMTAQGERRIDLDYEPPPLPPPPAWVERLHAQSQEQTH